MGTQGVLNSHSCVEPSQARLRRNNAAKILWWPDPMKKRRRPRNKKTSPNLLRATLVLYLLASLAYWLAGALDLWQMRVHWDRRIQAPFSFDIDTHIVKSLQPEAKVAGLSIGDRIEGLNGGPYTGLSQWSEILSDGQPGDTLDVEFIRPDGSRKLVTITMDHAPYIDGTAVTHGVVLAGIPPRRPAAADLPRHRLLGCSGAPSRSNAWLLLTLLTFPGVLFFNSGLATGISLFLRSLWYHALQIAASPTLLLFGIYFPERSRIDARAPWIKWILLAPMAICLAISSSGALCRLLQRRRRSAADRAQQRCRQRPQFSQPALHHPLPGLYARQAALGLDRRRPPAVARSDHRNRRGCRGIADCLHSAAASRRRCPRTRSTTGCSTSAACSS